MQNEDSGMHTAEVFIIEGKIIGFASSKAEEAASILKCNSEFTGAARDHMSDSKREDSRLQINAAYLKQKAAHFNKSAFSKHFGRLNLEESACLSAMIAQIVFTAHSDDLRMLILH